ncbi:hypothetical protein LOTGIDRAFT_231733 [Lottia gigantea]|uniref:Uncharacterized protein n=1 Tax=Lottia gigantea TaxID=225164 RepID=V3ZZI1_LOTGI|nr:hypothetical protein LOTGIDRAFT_231733 [Lottia gigantea]ESO96948.1 hypothetical protein LOTGIDRAFT_231733 [Lottia gigantea]
MQMGVLPENSSHFSVGQMDKNDNSSVARRESQMKSVNTKDVVDSVSARSSSQAANPSWLVSSGFSNFLKKKTNLDHKEMNAMAPSF